MKILKHKTLIIFGLTTLLMTSCSSMMNMVEPEASIRYDKEEFDYSKQVTGEATSVKILMVDWNRLFKNEKGSIAASSTSSIFGLLPSSKIESHALYDLFSKNPGYDFIVYPQYEVTRKAPGIGLFYSKTTAITRARLAVTNDIIIEKAENDGMASKKSKEMEASLSALQRAYDSLVGEVSDIKTQSASMVAMMQRQVQEAKNHATVSQQNAAAPRASETITYQTPPASSNAMSSPSEVRTVSGTYTLIIASYSTSENAERALTNFNAKYPNYKGRVGVVMGGGKYRLGFINFRTRNDAIVYRTNLTSKYPEFKSAWPYKP